MMAKLAKEYRSYLTVPIVIEHDDGRHTNSAVLLDRQGCVVGVYEKYFPTIGEVQVTNQISPGKGAVTFDTDFGRVGILICYDLNFHELRQQYLEQKAKLLIFPSMFPGGLLAQTWAILNHCYFVSAFRSDGSTIIDPLGRVLGVSAMPLGHILTRRINMDFEVLHVDGNHLRFEELQRRFGGRYTLEVLGPEAFCLLTSRDPQVSAQQMCKELKFEDVEAFFDRSRVAREKAVRGEWTPVQPPTWPE
jgi:predicted amidohydrolase